jgi:metallophosphoesterase superfamily enzyme
MSTGVFYKFDDKGDKQALALMKKTKKKNEIMVAVTGTHDGDILKVTSIKEVKSIASTKVMKKM